MTLKDFPSFKVDTRATNLPPYILDETFMATTKAEGIYGSTVKGDATLHVNGLLEIQPGFRWDMGTGTLDDPPMMVASLAHDAIGRICDEDRRVPWWVRREGDRLFRVTLIEFGASPYRAWVLYAGVSLYSYWKGIARLWQ